MSVSFSSKRRGFLAGAATCWAWMAQSTVLGASDNTQLRQGGSRSSLLTNLANEDSHYHTGSHSRIVRSELAIELSHTDNSAVVAVIRGPETSTVAKLIKIPRHELSGLQCEISNISLILEPSGVWQLKVRGDQLADSRRDDQPGNTAAQINRPAMRVNVRLLRSQPAAVDRDGRPVLADLPIDDFSLASPKTQAFTRRGTDPQIARYFHQINQAELEFFA